MIGLALIVDALVRDPPNRFHPVAWMGAAIAAAQRSASRSPTLCKRPALQLLFGSALMAIGTTALCTIGITLEQAIQRLRTTSFSALADVAEALLLYTLFTLRGLTDAASSVQTALDADDLAEARRLLAWHLVSRDPSGLSSADVAAATIESVAENASDGIIAPLLAYALAGLPGALVYRFANTADAMLGYRDAEREWLGKAAARLDDLLNLAPARLTALLLIASAPLTGADARNAWRAWRRDHAQTDSPNAGHPMSAMAGALHVALTKRGHYTLGAGQSAPRPDDIGRANQLVRRAVLLGVLLLGLFAWICFSTNDR